MSARDPLPCGARLHGPEIVASLRRLSPYWDAAKNAPRPEALSMMEQTEMPQAHG